MQILPGDAPFGDSHDHPTHYRISSNGRECYREPSGCRIPNRTCRGHDIWKKVIITFYLDADLTGVGEPVPTVPGSIIQWEMARRGTHLRV
ncbi:MAG: hypothetical protein CM1200mP14_06490 [Gammaproteobacteria bacterium]|nr:MAG: hypothetical protein CM1200mP14_06490 [Gammaproteobacteria bacterium]